MTKGDCITYTLLTPGLPAPTVPSERQLSPGAEGHAALQRNVKGNFFLSFFLKKKCSPSLDTGSKHKTPHAHKKVNPDPTELHFQQLQSLQISSHEYSLLLWLSSLEAVQETQHTYPNLSHSHRPSFIPYPMFQRSCGMIDKLLNFTTCSQNEGSAILEETQNLTSLNSLVRPLRGCLFTAPVCLSQHTSLHTFERLGKNKI